MGNLKSHHHHHNGHTKRKAHLNQHISDEEDYQIQEVYKTLIKPDGRIGYWEFQEKFGTLLSAALWKFLQHEDGHIESSKPISLEEFTEHADALMGAGMMSNNDFVELLMPVENLLRTSLEAGGVEVRPEDECFLNNLVNQITANGDDLDNVLPWINVNCPRICKPVQNKISEVFAHIHYKLRHENKNHSKILSPVELHFLRYCLPIQPYFATKRELRFAELRLEEGGKPSEHRWTELYWKGTKEDCIERFEEAVLDYYGATVHIFKLTNGDVFVMATDEEWRVDGHKFGGPHTLLLQFRPSFKRFDVPPPAIYCNFKSTSMLKGLNFGQILCIDEQMSNVSELEVWGCQGTKEMLNELHLSQIKPPKAEYIEPTNPPKKKGQTGQSNDWQNSVDKQLLEMAGFNFSSERKPVPRPPEEE